MTNILQQKAAMMAYRMSHLILFNLPLLTEVCRDLFRGWGAMEFPPDWLCPP